jgi:ribosomal subunit interface protein
MKLTVTGHQVVVTDAQRATIARRTAAIRRLLGGAALSAQVIVSRERTLTVCELTLHTRGDHVLHARGRDKRFAVALGSAIERVRRQAQKLLDRWKSRRKGEEV